MADRRAPGFLAEEIGVVPAITGQSTTVAAFLGVATSGPLHEPMEVPSFGRFVHVFGAPVAGTHLARSVRAYFGNGGRRCIVVRVENDALSTLLPHLGADHFVGLETAADVSTVCLPDLYSGETTADAVVAVQRALIAYCERHRRMAVLDPPPGLDADQVARWRRDTGFGSASAVTYWPWLAGVDQYGATTPTPPSGFVAGLWARNDDHRGVHRAPANLLVRGVVGPMIEATPREQEQLNPLGVNLIRRFPGRGTVVWGARTLSGDPEWRYVSIRRYLVYLEHSISTGIGWAVFEPNDETLHARITAAISDFLVAQWRAGALLGSTPDEAFFVRCDAPITPPDAADTGTFGVLIGVALVRASEFHLFKVLALSSGTVSVTD